MKVLIALDHSDAAREAARTTVDLLEPLDPEYLVINVAQVPLAWAGAGYGFAAVAPLHLDALRSETETQQAVSVAEDARTAGVPDPGVEVATGDVVHEICEAAERHQVDLIVVGSHDRPLLARLFEPSVSQGVVRAAHRPVLVVPERT